MRGLLFVVVLATLTAVISCQTLRPVCEARNASNAVQTPVRIRADIKLWQGVVLLLCFGAFAIFVALLHRLIRTHIFYDAHLLDTFFDAGSDVNVALVACGVVARWAWCSVFTSSTRGVYLNGLVGHFWFSAGLVIQLFLFAIVAAEIRIKAPGAKTFLQVIKARFGAAPHIILTIFAFTVNVLVVGSVVMEGTRIMAALTDGLSEEVICIIIAIIVGIYTVLGGLGGTIYVAYFSCAVIVAIVMAYMCDFFWDPVSRDGQRFGDIDDIYNKLACVQLDNDNEKGSLLTFISRDGLLEGLVYILGGFGLVFVDQSFWQISIAAKPSQGVWGFLVGGICWFMIPFLFALSCGLAYWTFVVDTGAPHLIDMAFVKNGSLPIFVSQELFSENDGSFLIFALVACAVIPTASAEVLSAASIVVYDIYMTYVAPFRPAAVTENKQMNPRMQKAIRNEEYLEYDRRCVVLKHVVVISIAVLIIPIVLILLAIDIDLWWMFCLTSIIVNSCVLPISLAITWHRITGWGVASGTLGGFIIGLVCWLVYSSTYSGGIKSFRDNTGRYYPIITGQAAALLMGGIICTVVSLSCGGCDGDLIEEEEWERTREIDNPILPWSVKYAPDIKQQYINRGRPHFYAVRRTFKCPEITSYILGVLLAVCAVLVWPAVMLTADVFSIEMFRGWVWFALIWGIVVCVLLLVVPLVWEIVQVCKQAFYNRMWARKDRLEEEQSEPEVRPPEPEPEPAPTPAPAPAPMPVDSASMSSDGRDTMQKERWKTFIHLD